MSDATKMVQREESTIDQPQETEVEYRRAVPVVDVYENDDEILILADMPGVKADTLQIQLEAEQLHIRATQRPPRGSDSEYAPLEYRRIFSVPQSVDPEAVTAELDAGVLRISLSKSAAAKPRRIQVQSH